MESNQKVIGIDSGSVTVSVVEMDLQGRMLSSEYKNHYGKPADVLREILKSIDYNNVVGVAKTSSAPLVYAGAQEFDNHIAIIKGVKFFYNNFRSILNVGGEKFTLLEFDANGNYSNLKSNTPCAAGTGGFLDQQAKRLNLSGSAELSKKAMANTGHIPQIASRCSVFAKTDIIHSQQEGYSLEEICDGLCLGLANNISDTLIDLEIEHSPMIFTGGVARNRGVVKHLENIIGHKIEVHEYSHLFAAVGAVQLLIESGLSTAMSFSLQSVVKSIETPKEYFYDPLDLKLSDYPDFNGLEHYNYSISSDISDVEVDIYREIEPGSIQNVYMGIDVGSTSTKAIIIDSEFLPIAGFYTRTAGQPIIAVQAIFKACSSILKTKSGKFVFDAVGSTGSGRKFIGQLIGADTILNEISAHARAAVELDPDIDTIIEIGGQDAKFTTLRNGVVTFSQMNTVCAAGTGSFIEEQAQKLGVPLCEYASLAKDVKAPLTSDRCTVFMERDINHFLNKNYEVNEILSAALFSVRENYLQKVASEGSIGKRVCFQGATAKNKALIAAFEQKLKTPIFVSKYCHLTGALGAGIIAASEINGASLFRGLDIYTEKIPVRSETCELCLNNCRIRVAVVGGEEVAYGFLCGRDYKTKQYVKKEKVPSLINVRKKALAPLKLTTQSIADMPVVGLPAGLQLYEELPLWRKFFHSLGIKTVSSEDKSNFIKQGKKLAAAEFCAPVSAFYGHVDSLIDRSDIIFLPVHIADSRDERNPARIRKFCYYTQFASTLAAQLGHNGKPISRMSPVINHRANQLKTKYELFKAINSLLPGRFNFYVISKAYDGALEYYKETKNRLKTIYSKPEKGEIKVVLVGRPYTVLSESMNKDIPGMLASLGIEAIFMDALPEAETSEQVDNLLNQFHWAYPAAILEAVDFCARTRGIYPVFITSFKCSPDSFTLEYVKRIMDLNEKPYLILQIDEHDSNVGYETRIEAGIRSFRNHLESESEVTSNASKLPIVLPIAPGVEKSLKGKTVLLPNWDSFVIPLIAANMRNAGIDARVLEETPKLISSSMKMNTGQCIPVNIIAHEYISYIKKYRLNPGNTVLWMIKSRWACNIAMYASFIKSLLEKEGEEMGRAGVYAGDLTMVEISPVISIRTYFAYMFGGNLKKIGCMIRPYELNRGETDRVIRKSNDVFERAFLGELSFIDAVKQIIVMIDGIKYYRTEKPKVAIFGDLYVRDNDVMNQNLIACIENAGGEVVITPYSDYAKIISGALFKRWIKELRIPEVVMYKSLLASMELLETRYHSYLGKYIGKPLSSKNPEVEKELHKFNIRIEQEGESYENILKIFRIMKDHPDITLFIQTNPAFCCPSLVTEAMSKEIESLTGVPVLTITYDGTETRKNDVIIPYLKYAGIEKKSVELAEENISVI